MYEFRKNNREEFVQEQLQIELPLPVIKYPVKELTNDNRTCRGIVIMDIFGNDDEQEKNK